VQQDFWVEVDTSTSDLFIPHASCKTCADKFRYNSDASSTSKPLGVPFSIEKYHSVASGDLYNDTVTIAYNFAIAKQTFGAVRPSASFSWLPLTSRI
jgi:cathepsin D